MVDSLRSAQSRSGRPRRNHRPIHTSNNGHSTNTSPQRRHLRRSPDTTERSLVPERRDCGSRRPLSNEASRLAPQGVEGGHRDRPDGRSVSSCVNAVTGTSAPRCTFGHRRPARPRWNRLSCPRPPVTDPRHGRTARCGLIPTADRDSSRTRALPGCGSVPLRRRVPLLRRAGHAELDAARTAADDDDKGDGPEGPLWLRPRADDTRSNGPAHFRRAGWHVRAGRDRSVSDS